MVIFIRYANILQLCTTSFDLQRFKEAQSDAVMKKVLQELKDGRKRSHWIWFIFPILKPDDDKHMSETSKKYVHVY
jgi:uncharacterized protein (DUF1810 family)